MSKQLSTITVMAEIAVERPTPAEACVDVNEWLRTASACRRDAATVRGCRVRAAYTSQQRAAIIAGLRLLQRAVAASAVPRDIADVMSNGWCDSALDATGIDELCFSING